MQSLVSLKSKQRIKGQKGQKGQLADCLILSFYWVLTESSLYD
jgi:hypothetical protein